MTEEERKEFRAKYDDWKKTRKYVIVNFDAIEQLPDGRALLLVRTGEYGIKVGDLMGGAKVLKTEAYGKDLDGLGPGMTGAVWLNRMPIFIVEESYQG
jgi:hypothetical protein